MIGNRSLKLQPFGWGFFVAASQLLGKSGWIAFIIPPMNIKIEKQFSLIAKRKGEYHSFPTVARTGEQLLIAVRSALVDRSQPHGREGRVRLYRSTVAAPEQWQQVPVEFCNTWDWELDAIVSTVDDEFFLRTRQYRYKQCNDSYVSCFKPEALEQKPLLLNKMAVKPEGMNLSATYGHLQRAADGALLLPLYGGVPSGAAASPLLYHSYDHGESWSLRAVVADSKQTERSLNEFSMVRLEGEGWMALVRDNNEPHALCEIRSSDDGFHWGKVKETALLGHAPMLCQTEYGVAAIYRDLEEEKPAVSVALLDRESGEWSRLGVVQRYSGNAYNGGYGDLAYLGEGRLLAVYYLSDEDESPWIDVALLKISR